MCPFRQEYCTRDPVGFAKMYCEGLEQVLVLAVINRLITVGLNKLSGFGQ